MASPATSNSAKGRIARQGNMNETVHVYRYVTERTLIHISGKY